MAIPSTKATLKSYCLRALGSGVIDINVSDDQVDDRLDEALQYFAQYHYDGIRRTYLKYQYTAADKTRITSDVSESVTKNSVTSTWKEGQGILLCQTVLSQLSIFFPFQIKVT